MKPKPVKLSLVACLLALVFLPAVASAGARTLYLIRHGMYATADSSDDRVGKHLIPLGREQARLIGGRLARLPVKITSLTSSNFTRARESGDVIGKELHMTCGRDSLLHECSPYSNLESRMKGLEPGEADSSEAQLARAWARYARPTDGADAHDVLVCHGNVIRWMTCKAMGVDTKQWATMDIGNGSMTVIFVQPDGKPRVVTYSDVGHIPVSKQTWSGKGGNWGAKTAGTRGR